jgi:hypothetical protein
MFTTEIDFSLPKGYLDPDGVLHTDGVMRLATAADEILPLKDPRVQSNPAYLTVIVLARVITRLGSLRDVNTKVVEGLFTADLNFLQKLYERLNLDDDAASGGTAGEPEMVGDAPAGPRSPGFRLVEGG